MSDMSFFQSVTPDLFADLGLLLLSAWIATLGLGILLGRLPWFRLPVPRIEIGRIATTHPRYFRLGGVAIAFGLIVAFGLDARLVWDNALMTLVVGASLAFALGLIDDIWPLHWCLQLLGQIVLGLLLVQAGMVIATLHLGGGWMLDLRAWSIPGLPLLATVFWVVLVMNAINWIDGADGLMGSVLVVACLALCILSFKPEVNQPAFAIIMSMLIGALIGFLFLNWSPARLVAGTSGTTLLGFLIAALSVYAGTKVATALLVLVIPILDLFAVILTRLRLGRSLFLPGQEHLHHILLRLGFSSRSIALIYGGVTGLLAVLALSLELWAKIWVLVVVGSLFFGMLGWMQWILTQQLKTQGE
ncbi:MAG: undecaprenyl/decaprenyl-phosphate alpha-N-acetylglucosaminyl 1-phosphate transferase [Candidatus Moraniibacteriota bacterium]|nr:MAG: undecaprenyl/decaprenyl-phosphate alpha-N-acetylglucosaminyl 1-phosphate transferase [Candidatus Moranbacteria bacterium]